MGVEFAVLLGDVDVALRSNYRVGATVGPVLELPRDRLHIGGVETSALTLGWGRVESQSLRIQDAGGPGTWRSPYHVARPHSCRHPVFLALCSPRSLLGILSLPPLDPVSRFAGFADSSTMAGRASEDWDLTLWAILDMGFDSSRLSKLFACISHVGLRHWEQFVAVAAVAVELSAHSEYW